MSNASLSTFDAHTPKRISFILPTKNRAGFLEKALEGCRSLLGPEDELLVMDGVSIDGTHEVVKKYADIVDVFISEPEVDSNHAVNKGVLLARGKYVKLITDDDVFYREGMDQAVRVMEQNPEIDLLLCGGTKERDGITSPYSVPANVQYGKNIDDVFRYKGASGVGHVMRRASFAKLGILCPLRPNADVAFVLDVMKHGGVVRFCRINTYHHPIYDHSAIIRMHDAHLRDTGLLVKEYGGWWKYIKYRIRENFLAVLVKRYIKNMRTHADEKTSVVRTQNIWDGQLS